MDAHLRPIAAPPAAPDPAVADPYGAAERAAAALRARTGAERHDVALVLGSGWLPAADELGVPEHEFDATELPGLFDKQHAQPCPPRRQRRRHTGGPAAADDNVVGI